MPARAQVRVVTSKAEREAFDALSRKFRASLLRYYAKRVKETHEIEDLVQEVFLRLVRRERVTDLDYISGYVFQTASSVLKDWLRQRRTRCADEHDQMIAEEIVDVADLSPERVLTGKRRLAAATAILMELPERTRTVFVLKRMEGLRYKDISKRLNMPLRTVERHMQRAVAHLTARLEEE